MTHSASLSNASEPEATSYSVAIRMDDDTVDALEREGCSLYAVKAVIANAHGAPLVWCKLTQFPRTTEVSWTVE